MPAMPAIPPFDRSRAATDDAPFTHPEMLIELPAAPWPSAAGGVPDHPPPLRRVIVVDEDWW